MQHVEASIVLLPCPFCEGPPVPVCVRGVGGGVFLDSELAPNGLYVEAHIFCHECGCQGESFRETFEPFDYCPKCGARLTPEVSE